MDLKYAIVHDLRKQAGQLTSTVNLRNDLLNVSQSLTNLFESLHGAYQRKSIKGFGQFDSDTESYRFSTQLKEFKEDATGEKFVEFSKKSMALLRTSIASQNFSTGGYVLFIWFVDDEQSYLFITLLRQTVGCVITDNLDIDEASHLELDKLHTGCQIDISTWDTTPNNQYITFIKGRSTQNTPEYFLKAIGCTEFANSAIQTNELIRALNDFATSKRLSPEEKQAMKQKVYDYCLDRENVLLDSLSQLISSDAEPNQFVEFINQGDYKVGNGFEPHSIHLRKLKEIKASGEGIQLKFPAGMLGTRIQLDEIGKKITINNPPENIVRILKEESK